MTCSACGCKCGGGAVVRREAALAAPLLNLEKERTTDTEELSKGDALIKEMAERGADRIIKFTIRGLLILLGQYLFACMKRFAVMYIGEDTGFSTFAVIVVSVPMAEMFCILGKRLTTV